MTKSIACMSIAACAVACLLATARAGAQTDSATFSTLYSFEAPAATTFTSPLGSQPDTLPAIGSDGAIYGMTTVGGQYGNGVIYRFDRHTHQYKVLHTFSALDANGDNEDGATPGVAVTRGPGDVIYGMASLGGKNGTGTIFAFNPSGDFVVLHTFSAVDSNGLNPDGSHIHCARLSSAKTAAFTVQRGLAGQTSVFSPKVAGSPGGSMSKATLRFCIRSRLTRGTPRRCCRRRTETYMAARCGPRLRCLQDLCRQGSCTG